MAQLRPTTLAWLPVLGLGAFILAPQLALLTFSFIRNDGTFTLSGVRELFGSAQFFNALALSLVIALAAVLLLIVVLVPALTAVHLWAPRLQGVLNILCTLPLVIPSIALVAGLMSVLRTMSSQGRGTVANQVSVFVQNNDFPFALIGTYVVLCLPFTYRSINAALSVIPLRVFYEASSSLGAGTFLTLAKVILPNIRSSIIFSAFFTFALSLGEYTVAATMSVHTLPVFMTTLSASNFRASIALSLLSNIITWVLLALAMILAEHAGRAGRGWGVGRRQEKVLRSTP